MKLTLASHRVQYSYEAGQEPDVPRADVGRDVSSYGKGRAPRFALNVRIVSHHNGCQMPCGIGNSELGVGVSEESAYDSFRLDIFGFRARRLTSANSGFTSSRLPALNQRRYCTVIEYSHYYC
jgi:hypothetical protein